MNRLNAGIRVHNINVIDVVNSTQVRQTGVKMPDLFLLFIIYIIIVSFAIAAFNVDSKRAHSHALLCPNIAKLKHEFCFNHLPQVRSIAPN